MKPVNLKKRKKIPVNFLVDSVNRDKNIIGFYSNKQILSLPSIKQCQEKENNKQHKQLEYIIY